MENIQLDSTNDQAGKVINVPAQNEDEGEDLDIYDDLDEDGDDLSENELERIPNVGNSKRVENQTKREIKDVPLPVSILRNTINRDQLPPQEDQTGHVTWSARKSEGRTISDYGYMSGIRGLANTPASHFTDISVESR